MWTEPPILARLISAAGGSIIFHSCSVTRAAARIALERSNSPAPSSSGRGAVPRTQLTER